MSTFTASTTGTTINTGIRVTISGLNETHQTTRSFYKVNLTGSGYTVDDIDNVTLRFYCTATAGGGLSDAHFWTGDSGDNFGSIAADLTTFLSTRVYLETEMPITSTGYKWLPIDKTHLDYNGWNYFTLNAGSTEYVGGANTTVNCTIASQDNATAAFRPILILYFKNGGTKSFNLFAEEISIKLEKEYSDVIQTAGLLSNNYFGDAGDGFVRKADVIPTGDPYDPDV